MGRLRNTMLRWLTPPELRARRIVDWESWMAHGGGIENLPAGIDITPDSALALSSVYACVRLLSRTIGTLPAHVYRRSADKRLKEIDRTHRLYPIIHGKPCPELTTSQWFTVMQSHYELRGNAYAHIERDAQGNVLALWPLHPDSVKVERINGKKRYTHTPVNAPAKIYDAVDILHHMGYSVDGFVGMSPIQVCAYSIAPGLAAQIYGGHSFGNGAWPGMVITPPEGVRKWGDEDARAFEQSWNARFQGPQRASKIAVMTQRVDVKTITPTLEDMQFVDTIKMSAIMVARIFGVQPHMIGDHEKGASYASVEQQVQDFLTHTIRPRVVEWEQLFNTSLFTERERDEWFIEFVMDSLLRADTKTRHEAYQIAAGGNAPWLSRNEIRAYENHNPVEGLDEILQPMNMGAAAPQTPSRPKQGNGNEEK